MENVSEHFHTFEDFMNANVGGIDEQDILRKFNDETSAILMPVTLFIGLETVLGFLGNVLVLYVFLRHYHKCNFRYFVLALSVIDFISTLTALPGEIIVQTHWYMFPSDVLCRVKTFFNMFTVTSEALCLMSIAVDRYRKVCQPLAWQIHISTTKIICLANYFFGLFLSLPVLIAAGNRRKEKTYFNNTLSVIVCDVNEKYVGSTFLLVYNVCLQAVMSICLLVIIASTILIIRSIFHIFHRQACTQQDRIPNRATSKGHTVTTHTKGTSGTSDAKKTSNSDIINESSLVTNDSSQSHTLQSSSAVSLDTINSDQLPRCPPVKTYITKVTDIGIRKPKAGRVKQRTKIMLILTLVFTVTTILYLISVYMKTRGLVDRMSDTEKVVFLFCFRFVYINHVINPFVYGCLDMKFRDVVGRLLRRKR